MSSLGKKSRNYYTLAYFFPKFIARQHFRSKYRSGPREIRHCASFSTASPICTEPNGASINPIIFSL
jgi:hypothetical protein